MVVMTMVVGVEVEKSSEEEVLNTVEEELANSVVAVDPSGVVVGAGVVVVAVVVVVGMGLTQS